MADEPEGKPASDDKALADMKASIEKLEAKDRELLAEKKAAQEAREAAERERDEREEAAAKAKGDAEAIEAAVQKKYAKQLEDAQRTAEQAQKDLRAVVVDKGLMEAVNAANVAPQFRDSVMALIGRNEIAVEDGKAVIDGKPLGDFVGEWAKSDAGKHYIAAPANGGGGAVGGATGTKALTKDNFNLTEFMNLKAENPSAAAAWAKEAGQPELMGSAT